MNRITEILIDSFIALKYLYKLPFIVGNPFTALSKPVILKKNYPNDINIFFINGICCDDKSIDMNVTLLENSFKQKVVPLVNLTNGLISDIKECIYGRTFNKILHTDIELAQTLIPYLNDKVIVIAHSQGGIIINNIVRYLIEQNIDLSNLEIYTFASASDELVSGDYYAEHFANTIDYVSSIGVLEYFYNYQGKLYIHNTVGHLFFHHYLINFIDKKYCRGKSRLYSYLK